MKKILFILVIIGACAVCCTRTNSKVRSSAPSVPPAKYLDMGELERLCYSDSTHHKALIFTNPYCCGCNHSFKEYLNPLMEEIDTSVWRFYYLLVVDSTDTIRYANFMADCWQMCVDTNRAYIWRHSCSPSDYNKVFALFHSIHPLENCFFGIPRMILLDNKNYIAEQKVADINNRDSIWFEPMRLDSHSITLEDFSVVDTSGCLLVSNKKGNK